MSNPTTPPKASPSKENLKAEDRKVAADEFMDTGNFSVKSAMALLNFSGSFRTDVKSNLQMWKNFGKKNSHMYRAELFTSMSTSNLSEEAKFIVLFLFCVIKSQPRVLKELDSMSEAFKNKVWYTPVRDFVAGKVTQYVTAATMNKKFPAVNIPSTMPGFDTMVYCLINTKSERNIQDLSRRPTFAQINLSQKMQDVAKEGYAYYWDNIVKGTKNSAQTEAPKMREEYYKNSEGDQYDMLYYNGEGKLLAYPMADPEIGYTEAEVLKYMAIFN
jgi:hypothetical protein